MNKQKSLKPKVWIEDFDCDIAITLLSAVGCDSREFHPSGRTNGIRPQFIICGFKAGLLAYGSSLIYRLPGAKTPVA